MIEALQEEYRRACGPYVKIIQQVRDVRPKCYCDGGRFMVPIGLPDNTLPDTPLGRAFGESAQDITNKAIKRLAADTGEPMAYWHCFKDRYHLGMHCLAENKLTDTHCRVCGSPRPPPNIGAAMSETSEPYDYIIEAERKAGVYVEPHLAKLHDVGCVKRYGAVDEGGTMCACERRRLENNTQTVQGDGASGGN